MVLAVGAKKTKSFLLPKESVSYKIPTKTGQHLSICGIISALRNHYPCTKCRRSLLLWDPTSTTQRNSKRLGGSNLAQTPILKNIPIRVNHALHALEPNRWVICCKVNSVVKQSKDLQKFRGRGGGAPHF